MKTSPLTNRGFTLIELLIVVSIIGLLASFVLPALNTVLEKAQQSNCRNHLMQMGRALKLYQQDNGRGVLFPSENGSPFVLALYGDGTFQISEHTIFVCPGTIDDNKKGVTYDEVTTGDEENVVSFAGRQNEDQAVYPGVFKLDSNTSSTTLIADDLNQPEAINPGEETNHIDSSNFLFLDLHVDTQAVFRQEEFETLYDPLTN